MEPTLAFSAVTALAYAAAPASGAFSPNLPYVPVHAEMQTFRIVTPTIQLTPLPVEISPELESVVYASMSHDFERRYTL